MLRAIFSESFECLLGILFSISALFAAYIHYKINNTEPPLVHLEHALCLDLHAPQGSVFRQVKPSRRHRCFISRRHDLGEAFSVRLSQVVAIAVLSLAGMISGGVFRQVKPSRSLLPRLHRRRVHRRRVHRRRVHRRRVHRRRVHRRRVHWWWCWGAAVLAGCCSGGVLFWRGAVLAGCWRFERDRNGNRSTDPPIHRSTDPPIRSTDDLCAAGRVRGRWGRGPTC